jgi:hypothetical protein
MAKVRLQITPTLKPIKSKTPNGISIEDSEDLAIHQADKLSHRNFEGTWGVLRDVIASNGVIGMYQVLYILDFRFISINVS